MFVCFTFVSSVINLFYQIFQCFSCSRVGRMQADRKRIEERYPLARTRVQRRYRQMGRL